jgi:hypothetical protein
LFQIGADEHKVNAADTELKEENRISVRVLKDKRHIITWVTQRKILTISFIVLAQL